MFQNIWKKMKYLICFEKNNKNGFAQSGSKSVKCQHNSLLESTLFWPEMFVKFWQIGTAEVYLSCGFLWDPIQEGWCQEG